MHNMNTLEYSIVYAMIRPEISERVSVGIIFCQDGQLEMKYSNAKLEVVKQLLSEAEYNYLRRALTTLSSKNALESVSSIDYLNRYSNNILTVSGLRKVKVDSPRISKDRLYKMYVYKGNSWFQSDIETVCSSPARGASDRVEEVCELEDTERQRGFWRKP